MTRQRTNRGEAVLGKKRRMSQWVKYALPAAVLVLLGTLAVFLLWKKNTVTEDCPVIKLFSDGRLLYFADVKTGDKTYSYDPETHEVAEVLDEAVSACWIRADSIFYSGKEGVFLLNRATKQKKLLLPYGQEKRELTAELNGEALLDTPVTEESTDFCEENGLLCFAYHASRRLQTDGHTDVGEEQWVTIYRYDTKTGQLSTVTSDYKKRNFVSQSASPANGLFYHNLRLINGMLYYQTGNDVCRLSLDGEGEERIYRAEGRLGSVYWNQTFFYCLERVELDLTQPSLEGQDTGLFVRKISLDGELLSSRKLEDGAEEPVGGSMLYYDAASDLFYAYREETLICFSLENPKAYTVKAETSLENGFFSAEMIAIGDRVYIALFPVNGRIRRAKDYVIIEAGKQKEADTVIKNGKPVPR